MTEVFNGLKPRLSITPLSHSFLFLYNFFRASHLLYTFQKIKRFYNIKTKPHWHYFLPPQLLYILNMVYYYTHNTPGLYTWSHYFTHFYYFSSLNYKFFSTSVSHPHIYNSLGHRTEGEYFARNLTNNLHATVGV